MNILQNVYQKEFGNGTEWLRELSMGSSPARIHSDWEWLLSDGCLVVHVKLAGGLIPVISEQVSTS